MAEALPLMDTNILLRHLLQDHPDHSPRATRYLTRVEQGEVRVRISDPVIFETVFILQRGYRQDKARIRELLWPILALPGIVLPGKQHWNAVFDLYVERNVSVVDAYHAVLMRRLGLTEILSFDRGFDRIEGLTRVEP